MANNDAPHESQGFNSGRHKDDKTNNDQNNTTNNDKKNGGKMDDTNTYISDKNSGESTVTQDVDPLSSPNQKLVEEEDDQAQYSNNTNTPQTESVDDRAENNDNENNESSSSPKTDFPEIGLDQLYQEVDQFISTLSSKNGELHESGTLEIPQAVGTFLEKVQSKIDEYEPTESSSATKFGQISEEDTLFLSAIDRVCKLIDLMVKYKSESMALVVVNEASSVLQCAMSFMEDELHFILEEAKNPHPPPPSSSTLNPDDSNDSKAGLDNEKSSANQDQTNSTNSTEESEVSANEVASEKQEEDKEKEREKEEDDENSFPCYSDKDISIISSISRSMVSAGYGAECLSVFAYARRSAFLEELSRQGLEQISIDDILKMHWEQLEVEIGKWVRIVKHCSANLLTGEEKFYRSVFLMSSDDVISSIDDSVVLPQEEHHQNEVVESKSHHNSISIAFSKILFTDLSLMVAFQFITFAEAVAMSIKSTEKLFKVLDMYEVLKDLESVIDKSYFSSSCTEEGKEEIKSLLEGARRQLGAAAAGIFYELELSIKNDNNKQPVPNGAVHPLTRYIMNYLKYACEYRDTLEEIFRVNNLNNKEPADHEEKTTNEVEDHHGGNHVAGEKDQNNNQTSSTILFSAQSVKVMGLLDANLDSKSKLYKDGALRNIFLMNNGRYMLKKIKGTPELQIVMGDKWYRSRSMDMRSYHKNYQRETWGRVLKCLSQEGLVVKGKVDKPVLKERFKNFNQIFDEILRTQSTWVVCDDQLQSELRVSISAVMIPAYRGFHGRFGQNFTPGRQYEKYVKYQPEDIEEAIEQLFEGNANSMARRR